MPFLFLIVGVVFVVSAARDTQDDLLNLLKGDFTGKNNFVYWFLSILAIGAVGYIPKLKPISVAFLALVIVVLFLRNGGAFNKITQALNATETTTPTATKTVAL